MDSPPSLVDCDMDARKRVCKACDRCRIKKSKCDGKKPCTRCRTDDAICVFGGRKKKSDRIHPKGYVEILERQQKQLVRGIRAIYDLHLERYTWNGPLPNHGYPPTHEILEYLGALDTGDSSDDEEGEIMHHFEEDISRLRSTITDSDQNQQRRNAHSADLHSPRHHDMPPSQRRQDYVGKSSRGNTKTSASSLRLIPDSLSTSRTSPSNSVDSQHSSTSIWLGQKQNLWSNKLLALGTNLMTSSDNDVLESPMQGAFEDSFLVDPWDPEEDIRQLLCT